MQLMVRLFRVKQLGFDYIHPLSDGVQTTGCFRVRYKFHPPPISVLDGPILKSFGVVIAISLRFCLVYLDGLYVGNYPSKICHDFWAYFTIWRNLPEIWHWSSVLRGGNSGSIALYRPYWLQWHQLEWQSAYTDRFFWSQKGSYAEKHWLTVTLFLRE